MRLFFLGGVFDKAIVEDVNVKSRGVVQNAADSFQKNLIYGLVKVFPSISIFSLPFLGSYPLRYNDAFVKGIASEIGSDIPVTRLGFINISIVKYISRAISVFFNFMKVRPGHDDIVMVYSLHVPFLIGLLLSRFISRSNFKVLVIVPDLPEYMNDSGGLFYSLLKYIESFILSRLLNRVSYYCLLTESMASRLRLKKSEYIVVEGVATHCTEGDSSNSPKILAEMNISEGRKAFFYSGTLAKRYGIKLLLDSFLMIKEDCELWICGDGDGRSEVEKYAKCDSRIKYFGQLPRSSVLELQKEATFLVNPRPPEGEYTRYSFPSKILEYMSSGRPVIMFRLEGIPSEYYGYCYTPKSASVLDLSACMSNVLLVSEEELNYKGEQAFDFVTANKSGVAQARRIQNFIKGNNDV
ncbi:glycosyl transferase group 1 protein [Ectopseudomonas oleovorans]|uniref:Glycosyl transferase group 1 protein n=1 Tax=Ectopseudomonas oleovorans TaxID=301 RepID=A0A379K5M1_ECTOL|nr:glycosyltransferase [Pseudomonas oleovorans]SUD59722.1 glycosyl transferase group 1 protein [Pseudomonas oleovorans]